MKQHILRLIALILCVAMLSGCGFEGIVIDWRDYFQTETDTSDVVRFRDMVYTRPDMAQIEQSITDACDKAAGTDFNGIIDAIYGFYDIYEQFYTNYLLADLHYCHDMTDAYWEEEYSFCMENSAVVDAALEELYYALAKSPCRKRLESARYFGEGYFDSYDGENQWDDEFVALLSKESELQTRYYELVSLGQGYDSSSEIYYVKCGNDMMELLVELIALRQQIAAYLGYTNYADFAWNYYHSRDYTPAQTRTYVERIRDELVPLYRQAAMQDRWSEFDRCTASQTFGYVKTMAQNMGGTVKEAFDLMEAGQLYDIAPGPNKYDSSFEVYLTSYYQPFVFLSPTNCTYDYLSFSHEFGHFCNDYVAYGSNAGTDVSEFFSQGMEYLSLCYAQDPEELTRLKMVDSLCVYVEQAAFASFELQMYDLTGEELTAANLRALYDRVAQEFGFDAKGYDSREFVTISHFYSSPMYLISYVVSNDAAMQLYQLEQQEPGAGLALYTQHLDSEENYFLTFVDTVGLESPFARGRIRAVRDTFTEIIT